MEPLKKCPFCDGNVYLGYRSQQKTFIIWHHIFEDESQKCPFFDFKISTKYARTLAEAADIWNRRADENG